MSTRGNTPSVGERPEANASPGAPGALSRLRAGFEPACCSLLGGVRGNSRMGSGHDLKELGTNIKTGPLTPRKMPIGSRSCDSNRFLALRVQSQIQHFHNVAQLAERPDDNRLVGGSSPSVMTS